MCIWTDCLTKSTLLISMNILASIITVYRTLQWLLNHNQFHTCIVTCPYVFINILIKFSEKAVRCNASYFVKIIWCSRWFCNPLFFNVVYCFICGWLLLDFGWFVLFLNHCSSFRCWAAVFRLSNNFTFFASGMHICQTFLLVCTWQSGDITLWYWR